MLLASADAKVEEAWSHRAKGVAMAQNPVPPTFLPDTCWEQWLWDEDPNEEAHADILLNRMQLLGLLIARFRAAYQDLHHTGEKCLGDFVSDGFPNQRKRLCLFDGVPVRKMSLRQLRDSVDNLRVEWFRMRIAETMQPRINDAVDALFHRFGVLASQPWPMEEVLDDPGSVEPSAQNVRMTRICVRRFVNAFFAMYRCLQVWALRQTAPDAPDAFDCGIRIHHVVASSDDFYKLSMHWDLMLAAKLNYIHDFRGYFNCISQVIYFHDPDYQRRPQDKKRIADISSGLVDPDSTKEENPINAVHMVPPLMQLYPDIEVRHADDVGDLLQRAAQGKWTWLFAGRTLYLVAPGGSKGKNKGIRGGGVRILHHAHVAPLLHAYLVSSSPSSTLDRDTR